MRIEHDKAAVVNGDAQSIAVADIDCPVGMPGWGSALGKIRAFIERQITPVLGESFNGVAA
jgi:hypothetical protein